MNPTKKHCYLVSFGDSDTYRFEYEMPADADDLHKPQPFSHIEEILRQYLSGKFPGQSFAFLTSAKATEIDPAHADRYSSYPILDSKAILDIENVISREARDMNYIKNLNSNAPYDDTNPDIAR